MHLVHDRMHFLRLQHVLVAAFFAVIAVPSPASALSFVDIAQLFNIFVGLMLTAAFLLFFSGLWVYFSRLGTWPNNRDDAIKTMEWGAAVLFTLIIILALVQFFQRYPAVMSYIVGGIIVLILIGFTLKMTLGQKTEKKEH